MTVQEFSDYNYEIQYQMLRQQGVFLMTRATRHVWVVLFAFDGFYVEVAQVQDSGKIRFIKSFAGTQRLDPYLSKININPILNT